MLILLQISPMVSIDDDRTRLTKMIVCNLFKLTRPPVNELNLEKQHITHVETYFSFFLGGDC